MTPESQVEWEHRQGVAALKPFGEGADMRDRRVLDVGCGFGGKSAHLARCGARSVTGIDISAERIEIAAAFARRLLLKNVSFEAKDIVSANYPPGAFDTVLMLDVIEHLSDPLAALRNCYRLLDQGGRLLVSFPPYGSLWGAHLIPYVSVPWAQLLFADQTLVKVWRGRFEKAAPGLRAFSAEKRRQLAEAQSVREIWHLNGMTIAWFEELLAKVPFKIRCRRPHVLWSLPRVGELRTFRERLVTRYLAVLGK